MSSAVVSLFAGAGGLSSGFADAGLQPVLAVEIDSDAVATYRANVSEHAVLRDIGVDAEKIVREVRDRSGGSDILAVIGGPPCQGFTTAGSRTPSDPRNRLVYSYLEIVRELKPSWFIFENVEGILTSCDGDAVVELASQFSKIGYTFRIEKLNFAGYGVPQARKRVVIVGNRHAIDFRLPESSHAYDGKKHRNSSGTLSLDISEALAGLPRDHVPLLSEVATYTSRDPLSQYDRMMRGASKTFDHHTCANFQRDSSRIAALQPGQSMKDLPETLWPESYRSRAFRRVADGMPTEKRGGAPAGLRRLAGEHVSLTITSLAPREFIHPTADRPLTLRECARLQSFPDCFSFSGGFQSVAVQIGNAFPPIAARRFAEWLQDVDGTAGSGKALKRAPADAGLIGYRLTDAKAMSPALQRTNQRLQKILSKRDVSTFSRTAAAAASARQESFFFEGNELISPDDKKLITSSRNLKPVVLKDRELARLVSVMLHDLGHVELIPQWVGVPEHGDYYQIPLSWFVTDAHRDFDFAPFFLECCDRVANFRIMFKCLCELHKRRRKFAEILRTQPIPTMDQVARRGLLELGSLALPGLTSWLMWRKWIYDIDNRSAQETGYLFEPMLAASLGGKTYGARNSPVTREGAGGKGRQVDCIVDADERLAYEFKARVTIAASGQGRFAEELTFPSDCRASGFMPILLVMDPTENGKLTQLRRAFEAPDESGNPGGRSFVGDEVWKHVQEKSGLEIAKFVKKYIKDPIVQISAHEDRLLDLGLRYRIGADSDIIEISVGGNRWDITPRPQKDKAEAIDEDAEVS